LSGGDVAVEAVEDAARDVGELLDLPRGESVEDQLPNLRGVRGSG
jgi:hypothetical protein